MALRTSSAAAEASAISPLRTPRERAWPTPMTVSAPAAFTSPTTAQTLDVPISSPTMMEAGSNMLLVIRRGFERFGRGRRRDQVEVGPEQRRVVGDAQVEGEDLLPEPLGVFVHQAP